MTETERKLNDYMMSRRNTPRKLALFACACVRHTPGVWALVNSHVQNQIASVERAIVNPSDRRDRPVIFHNTHHYAGSAFRNYREAFVACHHTILCYMVPAVTDSAYQCRHARRHAARASAYAAVGATTGTAAELAAAAKAARRAANRCQLGFAKCIFGPDLLYRTPVIEPHPLLTALASADDVAYPVLADALQERGVDQRALEHCQTGGPHYHGCWVVDAILGL